MKKSISILSLIAVILIAQSCERTGTAEDSMITEIERPNNPLRSDERSSEQTEWSHDDQPQANQFKTGEDEEPKRDKQHWRKGNDSLK